MVNEFRNKLLLGNDVKAMLFSLFNPNIAILIGRIKMWVELRRVTPSPKVRYKIII